MALEAIGFRMVSLLPQPLDEVPGLPFWIMCHTRRVAVLSPASHWPRSTCGDTTGWSCRKTLSD